MFQERLCTEFEITTLYAIDALKIDKQAILKGMC